MGKSFLGLSMRTVYQLYLEEKLRIVEEYRSNKGVLNELARKYRISHTAIWSWNRIFALEKRPKSYEYQ